MEQAIEATSFIGRLRLASSYLTSIVYRSAGQLPHSSYVYSLAGYYSRH